MIIHDEDINGGEAAARCEFCGALDCDGHREQPIDDEDDDKPETFTEARAFIVSASAEQLRKMRRDLKARGFGDTPGLDSMIEERERTR